jgi:glycosyltransferase involved in cell wall biosynthesis
MNVRPVLHLSNDFLHQDVYTQLIRHLDARGLRQWIYVAARERGDLDRRWPETERLRFEVDWILRRHHKIFYSLKIRTMRQSLLRHFDPAKAGLVHGHFLFTDGTLARQLHEQTGVPFVITVRPNTDINAFMRLRPDLLPSACATLRAASAVIFLTPGARDRLVARLPAEVGAGVLGKSHVIPSAISPEWHDAPATIEPDPQGTIRLVSVSDLSPNKNARGIFATVERLIARGRSVRLTLVGGSADRIPPGAGPWLTHRPHTHDRLLLRGIMREHDIFIMPSFSETFGLAYVEALSQGLPAIHSRGEAISGLFTDGVVTAAVDPRNSDEMADAVERLHVSRPQNWRRCIEETQSYRWPSVAERVHAVYCASGLDASA